MINLELVGLIAISWIVIWFFERGNLSVLGLRPTNTRIKYSFILFFITAICCSTSFFMRMYFGKEEFVLNPQINTSLVFTGLWLNVKSVLFEELLCRGVGLYILIKKLGAKRAILISSVIFALLHLFNKGAVSNLTQVIFVLGFTFFMGLVLAYAYAKTFSIYLPIAIHSGWNLTENFIFSGASSGSAIFVSAAQPLVTVSWVVYFTILLFPKTAAIVTNYFIIKKSFLLIKNTSY